LWSLAHQFMRHVFATAWQTSQNASLAKFAEFSF
jgi:hypothetical protein